MRLLRQIRTGEIAVAMVSQGAAKLKEAIETLLEANGEPIDEEPCGCYPTSSTSSTRPSSNREDAGH